MGSICWIDGNPKRWRACETGQELKPEFGGEELVQVYYGTFDDDPGGAFELEMLMRRSVYEKALSGEYMVSPASKWEHRLILIDSKCKEVVPIGTTVY